MKFRDHVSSTKVSPSRPEQMDYYRERYRANRLGASILFTEGEHGSGVGERVRRAQAKWKIVEEILPVGKGINARSGIALQAILNLDTRYIEHETMQGLTPAEARRDSQAHYIYFSQAYHPDKEEDHKYGRFWILLSEQAQVDLLKECQRLLEEKKKDKPLADVCERWGVEKGDYPQMRRIGRIMETLRDAFIEDTITNTPVELNLSREEARTRAEHLANETYIDVQPPLRTGGVNRYIVHSAALEQVDKNIAQDDAFKDHTPAEWRSRPLQVQSIQYAKPLPHVRNVAERKKRISMKAQTYLNDHWSIRSDHEDYKGAIQAVDGLRRDKLTELSGQDGYTPAKAEAEVNDQYINLVPQRGEQAAYLVIHNDATDDIDRTLGNLFTNRQKGPLHPTRTRH